MNVSTGHVGLGRLRKVVYAYSGIAHLALSTSALGAVVLQQPEHSSRELLLEGHGLKLSCPCTLQQPFCRECCQPQRTLAAFTQTTSGLDILVGVVPLPNDHLLHSGCLPT